MSDDHDVAVKAWDHSVLPIMDLWRAERFYTEVLDGAIFQKVGMDFPRAAHERPGATFVDPPGSFVKLGRHHLGLFLQVQVPVAAPTDLERAAPCWALTVAEPDFAAVVARVRESGAPVGPERTEVFGSLRLRCVRCVDTEGNCLELIADPRGRYHDRAVTGLSHMHFETRALAATADFYQRFLGMSVVAEAPRQVALGMPGDQCFVFDEVDALSPASAGKYHGRHFAFVVDVDTFHRITARLRDAGIAEGDALGRSQPGEYESYFYDPNNPSLWLQLQNKDSEQAAASRPRLKYTAA